MIEDDTHIPTVHFWAYAMWNAEWHLPVSCKNTVCCAFRCRSQNAFGNVAERRQSSPLARARHAVIATDRNEIKTNEKR